MPKTLPAPIETEVAKQYATKPIILVTIDWGGTVGLRTYSNAIYDGAITNIMSLSALTALVKLSGGSTGSIQITMDDNAGELKTILDTVDPHKRPCNLYLVYQDMATNNKALIFSGQLSTPVQWTDHPRQLSFTIVAKIEDKEIGFSPEQHAFEYISEEAVGKAWPLVFGNVIRYPAVKVTENIRGTCLTRYNVITALDLQEIWESATDYAKAQRAKDMADSNEILRRKYTTYDLDYEIQEVSVTDYQQILADLNEAYGNFLQTIDQLATKAFDLVYRIRDFAWAAYRLQYYTFILEEMVNLRVYLLSEIDRITNVAIPKDEKDLATERDKLARNKGDAETPIKIEALNAEIKKLKARVELYKFTVYGRKGGGRVPSLDDFGTFLGYVYDEGAPGLNWYIPVMNEALGLQRLNMEMHQAALVQVYLDKIEIDGGEKFPQNETVDILINEAKFRGHFEGRFFFIEGSFLGTDENVKIAGRLDNSASTFWLESSSYILKDKFCLMNIKTKDYTTNKIVFVHEQVGRQCTGYAIMWAPANNNTSDLILPGADGVNAIILETCPLLPERWIKDIDDPYGPMSALVSLPNVEWGMDIGDTVYLAKDYKDVYIVALNPISEIVEVMGRRSINGTTKLIPIPSRYYTKEMNYSLAGKTVPVLIFPRPLSQYSDEGWSDEVFVSVRETAVGSNTADIIKWLAATYAGLEVDTTTYTHVKNALANYPSHFILSERGNVLDIIEDIAWQARCALWVSAGKLYFKYLAEEVDAVITVDNDVIDATSLKLGISETDGLVTKYIATWRKSLSQEKPNQVILRNNIPKYGTMEETKDFYIYNVESLVVKSATFWMIRKSNTWKRVTFTGFLPLLKLEPFDIVMLDFGNTLVSTDPCKGVIESITFNPDNLALDYDVWVSVRAGEMVPYVFAWPATAEKELEYPSPTDLYAGGEWENL